MVELAAKGETYFLMDACALTFSAGSFDAVVDKGTLDAMLSIEDEEQSWCGSPAYRGTLDELSPACLFQLLADDGRDFTGSKTQRRIPYHIRTAQR